MLFAVIFFTLLLGHSTPNQPMVHTTLSLKLMIFAQFLNQHVLGSHAKISAHIIFQLGYCDGRHHENKMLLVCSILLKYSSSPF